MTTMLFTPIMMSAVRNGVPLPDMDGDVEQWAMSAHVSGCWLGGYCDVQCPDGDCQRACPKYQQYEKAKKELADAMDSIDRDCAEKTIDELVERGLICPDGPYVVMEGLGMLIEEPAPPAWLMDITKPVEKLPYEELSDIDPKRKPYWLIPNTRCVNGHEWYEHGDETKRCPVCGADQEMEVEPEACGVEAPTCGNSVW